MKLFYFLGISLLALTLQAQTHIFTGNGGTTNWHTASNWSANSVPTSSSSVEIPDGLEVHIANTAVAQSLTLSGSGTLILEASLSISETFSIETIAVFSFQDGDLSAGTIVNNGTMRFLNPEFKTISNTVINNHSRMDFISSNILNLEGIVTINNLSDGVMDILSNGGLTQANGATATLINDGLVKKYTENGDFGSFYMILNVTNNSIIEIKEDSQYLFLTPGVSFHNTSDGVLTGTGVFDITSPFLNEGTVSPGGDEIGELTFVNTFNLDGGTILIDIESLDSYDSIDVVGSPMLDGSIVVNYSPQLELDDTLEILISQFTINTCSLPFQVKFVDGCCDIYIYDVLCNSNSVVLKLSDILLIGVDEFNNLDFNITPNPIIQEATIALDSGILQSPHLEIYTMTGEKVKTIELKNEATTFHRASLADGMYFAQLVSEGKVITTEKIILK